MFIEISIDRRGAAIVCSGPDSSVEITRETPLGCGVINSRGVTIGFHKQSQAPVLMVQWSEMYFVLVCPELCIRWGPISIAQVVTYGQLENWFVQQSSKHVSASPSERLEQRVRSLESRLALEEARP